MVNPIINGYLDDDSLSERIDAFDTMVQGVLLIMNENGISDATGTGLLVSWYDLKAAIEYRLSPPEEENHKDKVAA